MANVKDLAASFVATAPSPATSGTSLVVTAATGANFPAAPFYATLTPTGNLSTPSTSEIVLVTAKSTDTLTITRAQKSTTAKSIAVGWVITNGIYVDDVFSSITLGEVPSGTVNGVTTAFTTAQPFTSIEVFRNGLRQKDSGNDYTVTNNTTITFTSAPLTGDLLLVNYIMGSSVMITGSNSLADGQTPTGTVDGSNTAFTTAQSYIGGTLQVFINGIKQKRTTHFTETTPSSGIFTMSDAPLTGDDIMVSYMFVNATTGNADTTDGYHVSATATANTLMPLDSSARIPIAAQPTDILGYVEVNTSQGSITTTETDLTGLSFTITMPVTDKKLLLECYLPTNVSTVAGDRSLVRIREGATLIQQDYTVFPALGMPIRISRIITPTAGSHTYKITGVRDSGSGSLTYYADSAPTIKYFMAKLV